mgnify:CR=1 FL=1
MAKSETPHRGDDGARARRRYRASVTEDDDDGEVGDARASSRRRPRASSSRCSGTSIICARATDASARWRGG